MNTCKCGLPLHKITVATIPGSIDTKFVEIEVCDNWLEQYHDEAAEQSFALRLETGAAKSDSESTPAVSSG